MNELMSLNIFAHSLGAALVGMGLFGGLILLPLWLSGDGSARATARAGLAADGVV